MPIVNNNVNDLQTFGKYGVYVSDTFGGTYTLARRLLIKNVRFEKRSLGACGCLLLPESRLNEVKDTVTLRNGMFIKILEVAKINSIEYTSVGDEIMIGTIEAINRNIYDANTDSIGSVVIKEIGWYFKSKSMSESYYSGVKLFNPVIDGVAYANRKTDEVIIETILDNIPTSPSTTPQGMWSVDVPQEDNVWSLEHYFQWLSANSGMSIKFPWEVDAANINETRAVDIEALDRQISSATAQGDTDRVGQLLSQRDSVNTAADGEIESNAAAYKFFKDVFQIRTFEFDPNLSVYSNIEKYLIDPFDFKLKIESTSGPTFVIFNTSPVVVHEVCPAAKSKDFTLDPETTVNFNVVDDDEYFHRIVYRGDYITYTGTLHAWDHNGSASLVADWTNDEEHTAVVGATQSDSSGVAETDGAKFIPDIGNVWRKFKFKYSTLAKYLQISGKATNYQTTEGPMYLVGDGFGPVFEMKTFFPSITFLDYSDGYPTPKTTPVVSYEGDTTPNPTDLKWVDTLPFLDERTQANKKAFAVALGVEGTLAADNRFYTFYEITKPQPNVQSGRIEWHQDGLSLNMSNQQFLSFYDDAQFSGNDSVIDVPNNYWEEDGVAELWGNASPMVTEYPFKGSWKHVAFTVAAKSSQKMEVTLDNPDVTNVTKVKVIEDNSLQCQIIHVGTVKGLLRYPANVQSDTGRRYRTGLDRNTTLEFGRNDFKKLYDASRAAAAYFFLQKNSATIETTLVGGIPNLSIGQLVGNIKDRNEQVTINTVVSSVEINMETNRITISTSKPLLPLFTSVNRDIESISPITSVSNPPTKKITEHKQPEPAGVIAGGAAASDFTETPHKVLQILYGQTVAGVNCIKHTGTTPTTFTPTDVYDTSFTPDGVGTAYLWTDGARSEDPVYVLNNNAIYNHLLMQGATITTYQTVSISGAGAPPTVTTMYIPFGG